MFFFSLSVAQMVKMMVTVVIVFTICWLPFNVLTVSINSTKRLHGCIRQLFDVWQLIECIIMHSNSIANQFQLSNEAVADWPLLPYVWFAFHWLAMSHSCYNPVIYCYMNARFRSGFRHIWHRLIYGRWWCACLRTRQHRGNTMLLAGGSRPSTMDGRRSSHFNSRRMGDESHYVPGNMNALAI